jgi:hypothetical protein
VNIILSTTHAIAECIGVDVGVLFVCNCDVAICYLGRFQLSRNILKTADPADLVHSNAF